MDYIESQIVSKVKVPNAEEEIVVYKTGSHSGFLTYDGIDVNGKRISDEILEETDRLEKNGGKVAKFSIVGFSLGGLISRYALGILYHLGYFNDVEAINFVTFCSPHVGARALGNPLAVKAFNKFARYILAHTGAQIFLKDENSVTIDPARKKSDKIPLLVWMATKNSIFYAALAQFKYRSLYANVINDSRTAWFTSAISRMDPFQSMVNANLSAYAFEYIDGYAPTVINLHKPVQFAGSTSVQPQKPKDKIRTGSLWKTYFWRKLKILKVILSIVAATPLWLLNLAYSNIAERIKLYKRVKSFYQSTSLHYLYHFAENMTVLSHDEDHDKRGQSQEPEHHDSVFTLIEKSISDQIEDQTGSLIESIYSSMNSDNYREYYISLSKGKGSSKVKDKKEELTDLAPLLEEEIEELVDLKGKKVENFRLPLTENECFIIKLLNMLEWNKFPVIIRKAKSTHSAAIVKTPDPTYEEGKVVVDHFVRETFKLE